MNNIDLSRVVWRKSSRSSGNGECVEVAYLGEHEVVTRDSKLGGTEAVLFFGAKQWGAFLRGLDQ